MPHNVNFVPRAKQHECTIIVRGSMHQAMLTSEAEFANWLECEGCNHTPWTQEDGSPYATCMIFYPDGFVSQRAVAHRINHFVEG